MTTKERSALATRNRVMAQAIHKATFKERTRRELLRFAALIPPLPYQMFEPGSIQRILLIRPDHVGDVLLTTPAIRALRDHLPYAEIHALVGPWSSEVMGSYPDVDLTLTLPFPGFSRQPRQSLRERYQFIAITARQLRVIGYSAAIIFRPDHWWGALLAKLAGVPTRIGYDHPDVAPFLTQILPQQHEHVVIKNLRLVEHWTGTLDPSKVLYHFPVEEADQAYVDGYLEIWGAKPTARIIAIHPGSGAALKNWTEDKWASVGDTLAEQLDAQVVLTGGAHEVILTRNIADRMKTHPIVAAGDTRIRQLAALFARCSVVLGSDSGPLHLAAAVGAPTVTLYGPADPQEFGPWGSPEQHVVITSSIGCRPCRVLDWGGDPPENHPCVRDIGIGAVLEAARRIAVK